MRPTCSTLCRIAGHLLGLMVFSDGSVIIISNRSGVWLNSPTPGLVWLVPLLEFVSSSSGELSLRGGPWGVMEENVVTTSRLQFSGSSRSKALERCKLVVLEEWATGIGIIGSRCASIMIAHVQCSCCDNESHPLSSFLGHSRWTYKSHVR